MDFTAVVQPPSPEPSVGWLLHESARLLDGARASWVGGGGFSWLDDAGTPDQNHPRALWITTRMTHCFALGALLGRDGDAEFADRGVESLLGRFKDPVRGGWFNELRSSALAPTQLQGLKGAYGHAFVLLAGSSAAVAGRPRGTELLAEGIEIVERHFWDDEAGAMVESWDRDWAVCEPYRGANANMHSIEAFLAVADATGDALWRDRALRIADRLINGQARANQWRLPEHYDVDWVALPEYNKDAPAHPFRPYGATPGHGFEWARLLLHLDAALDSRAPTWLRPAAIALFDRAVADGWFEESGGFAYTTDWAGAPVVEQRFHWVACEAIDAAAALFQVTGDTRYAEWYARIWAYARSVYLTGAPGWLHEVDAGGRPTSVTWSGRPDVYHALQTTLIPMLPLAPSLASALFQRT